MAEKKQGWSIPQILGTAFVTAVVWSAIGFSWFGTGFNWKTEGQSERMVAHAVTDRLAAICVAQAKKAPDSATALKTFSELSQWKRSDFVSTAGWATMPGSEDSPQSIASACAEKLSES